MALFIGMVVFGVLTVAFTVGYTALLKEMLVREFNKEKGE